MCVEQHKAEGKTIKKNVFIISIFFPHKNKGWQINQKMNRKQNSYILYNFHRYTQM